MVNLFLFLHHLFSVFVSAAASDNDDCAGGYSGVSLQLLLQYVSCLIVTAMTVPLKGVAGSGYVRTNGCILVYQRWFRCGDLRHSLLNNRQDSTAPRLLEVL